MDWCILGDFYNVNDFRLNLCQLFDTKDCKGVLNRLLSNAAFYNYRYHLLRVFCFSDIGLNVYYLCKKSAYPLVRHDLQHTKYRYNSRISCLKASYF